MREARSKEVLARMYVNVRMIRSNALVLFMVFAVLCHLPIRMIGISAIYLDKDDNDNKNKRMAVVTQAFAMPCALLCCQSSVKMRTTY